MITVIRSLLGNVFKTNEYLQFAVVTGYLTAVTPSCNAKDYELVIPDKEIHDIFATWISEWIEMAVIQGNTGKLMQFCKVASNGDVKNMEGLVQHARGH